MKRTKFFPILIVLFCLSLAGCDQLNALYFPKKKKKTPNPAPVVKMIDDMELAQALMKPEHKDIKIERDPFKPLISAGKDEKIDPNAGESELKKAADKIKFQGLVKVGDSFSALLKTDKKKGVFQVNDKFEQFTVTDIKEDYVTISKDKFNFQLKRGEK